MAEFFGSNVGAYQITLIACKESCMLGDTSIRAAVNQSGEFFCLECGIKLCNAPCIHAGELNKGVASGYEYYIGHASH